MYEVGLVINEFKIAFGYKPVISMIRDNAKLAFEMYNCILNCIIINDDTNYIMMIFKDYEDTFGTPVFIPEPSGSKKVVINIIDKSFKYGVDLVSLYLKGVSLDTLRRIIIDIKQNSGG